MNWKTYKALPPPQKQDEAYYIIGLDIGNDSSGIAFYNLHENTPEPIDLSGGYGKPSIPTVMQYIPETKEWVFGEYAILNQGSGTEITLNHLVQRLGSFDYVEINRKDISIAAILGLFIKELLGSVRNINPKAEIVGIIAAVPDKLSPEAHDELKRAFKLAGYEKELIALIPCRECVLAHHYRGQPLTDEKVLLLDYGSREVRGGVYSVKDTALAKALSNLFDESIGTSNIFADVHSLFESHTHTALKGETPTGLQEQLTAFTYQHKDILFQKNIRTKPAKLYYNFVYPPFQQTISHTHVEALISPYKQRFNRFIADTLGKNISEKAISPRDINAVICVGGGFEMLWAREAVADIFEQKQIHMYRNAKLTTAEGAAQLAANLLGAATGNIFEIEDTHKLPGDIGIKSGDVFLPLVERNTFWWQAHKPKLVLVNDKIDGELHLSITQRTPTGDENIISAYVLTGLPKRPKGTTRLMFGIDFKSNTRMTLKVSDLGFGDMFPKTGYQQELTVKLA